MLDSTTKRRIDDCRDILVGKVPDPKSQIEQITVALIYKFMHDMDQQAVELGGKPTFFAKHKIIVNGKEELKDYAQYAWPALFEKDLSGEDRVKLYSAALESMEENPGLPGLFRDIFKNAYLPYRDPATLREFLKRIAEFSYDHSEKLGDAFEYLLSIMGSQGDAGQFRTPRHLIDFMTAVLAPEKQETILDPACGTAGFLISAYKYILKHNSSNHTADDPLAFELHGVKQEDLTVSAKKYAGDKITPDQRKKLVKNIAGYDISPDMVRLSLVNLYLHGFPEPHIYEYDTLTSDERWEERFDVILANPPFMSPKGGIKPHGKYGIPSTRSEVLFVDYMAEHLNANGRAMIVVPEGIIFQSGKAYKALRKKLVDDKYLVGVISLPGGMFNPYSGVKTSLLWFDRALAKRTDKILFLKVEADGFDLGAQRRPIAQNDLPDTFRLLLDYKAALADDTEWAAPKGWEVKAAPVERKLIAKNAEYSLSGDRYVERQFLSTNLPLVSVEDAIEDVTYTTKVKSSEFLPTGKFPIIDQGEEFIAGYWNNEDDIFKVKRPLVVFGDHTRCFKYVDFDFVLGADGVKLLQPKEEFLPKYFYHVLRSLELPNLGYSRHYKELKEFQIPLPPLAEQEAIVAEVEGYQKVIDGARQVVAHYRPRITIDPAWPMVPFSEIADFRNGLNFTRDENGEKVKVLGVGDFQDLMHAPIDTVPYVELSARLSALQALQEGDLVFVRSNGNKELVGRSVLIPKLKEPVYHSGFTIRARLKDKRTALFMAYLFKAEVHDRLKTKLRAGANISNLSQEILDALMIPLPPLPEQQRIVAELEEERALVAASKTLVEKMEAKVRERVARVWGVPSATDMNDI